MSVNIIPFSALSKELINKDDRVIFGGTFDPVHEGHIRDIRLLLVYFSTVIVSVTGQNPWKPKELPPVDLELRHEMLRIVLAAENIQLGSSLNDLGVFIDTKDYIFACDKVQDISAQTLGRIYWAVAEDIAEGVEKWKNWSNLGVSTIVLPIIDKIHSIDIRANSLRIHKALESFVKKHHLYTN